MSETPIVKYRKDDIILKQGERDGGLYKVLSGSVALFMDYGRPSEHLLDVLSPPYCFGGTGVLANHAGYYTAVAASDAVLMHVTEENLDSFIRNDHDSAMTVINTMAKAMAVMQRNLYELVEGLRELSKAQHVEGKALEWLVARFEDPAAQAASAQEAEAVAREAEEALHRVQDREQAAKQEAGQPPKERATEAGQPFQYSGEPPAAPVSQWDATGLFPLGHRGYAGAVLPGYREFVFDKKYTCPNCRKEFKGLRTSAFKLTPVQSPGSRRYDLRAFYKDFQFEWFDVVSCPHCYFSALANPFADAKMLRKDRYAGALAEFRANVPLDFTAERDLDTVFAQHYLALICADGFMDALRHTAHLWMNLNWLYEDAGDEALRGYARDKAIEAYSAVYAQCRLNAVQEQRVCMALAGMLFGKGMWNEAREWAFKARINRAGKQNLADLAEQLIGDARAEIEARK